MQNLVQLLQAAFALVRKDASGKIAALAETTIANISAAGFSPATVIAQGDLFIAQVAALGPALGTELQTDVGNAIIAWLKATATPSA